MHEQMKAHRLLGCAAMVAVTACGQAKTFFVPASKTPDERAREISEKCAGVTDEAIATLLHPPGIDSVEPAYAYVLGGPNGREARLRGAKIHVKPAAGLTREIVARDLECRESNIILGRALPLENDPYVLPQRWVDIDVESEKAGFAVLVQTNDIDDAKAVLARARLFVSTPQ
jgi:hypothetical protein